MPKFPNNTVLSPQLRAEAAVDGIGEVASTDGDFPLGVTGKPLERYLHDKHQDLVFSLGDRRPKNLTTSAALA